MDLLYRLFSGIFKKKKVIQYSEGMIERVGREQFKKLVERGLTVPVAML